MNKEEILARVSEKDIFAKYLGTIRIGKMYRSPLRRENTASFHIIERPGGKLMFKDFGSGESGDCFKFVMLMFRTDFAGALKIIQEDMNLIGKHIPIKKRSIFSIIQKQPEVKVSEFEYIQKELTESELKYWKQFGITGSVLNEYGVISVEKVKEKNWDDFILSTPNCPIFAYKYPSGNIRFYRPLAFKRKFFGNSNSSDIFGYSQAYKEMYENKGFLPKLSICAGQKDAMSLYANTSIRTVALNSESAIVTKEIFDKLSKLSEDIVVCYDMDKTGRLNSNKICFQYKLKDIINDYNLLPNEKDISDYFSRKNSNKLEKV